MNAHSWKGEGWLAGSRFLVLGSGRIDKVRYRAFRVAGRSNDFSRSVALLRLKSLLRVAQL